MGEVVFHPYQHARYRAGLNVYIDPRIKEIHPLSPIAGKIVQTCIGHYYPFLESNFLPGKQTDLVPCRDGCMIHYVEEQYVCVD